MLRIIGLYLILCLMCTSCGEDNSVRNRAQYRFNTTQNANCYDGSGRSSPAGENLLASFAEEIRQLPIDSQRAGDFNGMVRIEGGRFEMGGDNAQARPDELPKHTVAVHAFWIDAHEVTNAEFAEFVEATGYRTVAERSIDPQEILSQLPPGTPMPEGISLEPMGLVFYQPTQTGHYAPGDWWMPVEGADWQQPQGPDVALPPDFEQRPVVQIAWYDAAMYCKWAGKRLPTEAEWEYAARGGLANSIYPWGNEAVSPKRANYWQGAFPLNNTEADHFHRVAPVGSFPANEFQLYDMAGNVWEWVADWYRPDTYRQRAQSVVENPLGPARSYDPDEPSVPKKVLRGGSFLCNDSYCSGYRVAARMKSSPDTGLEHTGCRCVRDITTN